MDGVLYSRVFGDDLDSSLFLIDTMFFFCWSPLCWNHSQCRLRIFVFRLLPLHAQTAAPISMKFGLEVANTLD